MSAYIPRVIMIVYIAGIVLLMGISENFRKQKEAEYKNDERWRLVKNRADSVLLRYFSIITVCIPVSYIITDIIFGIDFTFKMHEVMTGASYVLLLQVPVKYFALRYYDKVL